MTIRVSKDTYRELKMIAKRLENWIDTASTDQVNIAFNGVAPKHDRHGVTMEAVIRRLVKVYKSKNKKR